jgi:hypothetical protein
MAYRKEYYIANREKFNEKSRNHYIKNKDKILGQIKEKRAARTDEERKIASEKRKEYYLDNRDSFLSYAKEQNKKEKKKIDEMKAKLAEYEKLYEHGDKIEDKEEKTKDENTSKFSEWG